MAVSSGVTMQERWGEYQPDYAIPPGRYIKNILEDIGMSQAEFARRTNLSIPNVNRILQGKHDLSADVALSISMATGVSMRKLMQLQSAYTQHNKLLEQRKELENEVDYEWLKEIPYNVLVNHNLAPKTNDKITKYLHVLRVFGVKNRKSLDAYWDQQKFAARCANVPVVHAGATHLWIRLGQLAAESFDGPAYNKSLFEDILYDLRELTTDGNFAVPMIKRCHRAGVAVVFVPEFKNLPLHGAAMWHAHNPVVMLNTRGKSADQLWFTFYHESAHILFNHGKKKIFVDNLNDSCNNQEEAEADAFASEILIPSKYNDRIKKLRTYAQLNQIASEIRIDPGIVAGRYRYLTKNYKMFHKATKTLEWTNTSKN